MKFAITLFIPITCLIQTYSTAMESDDGGQYYDYYSDLYTPPSLSPPTTNYQPEDLMLVRTDFQKYLGRKLNWNNCIEVRHEAILLIEKTVSTEIDSILKSIKYKFQTATDTIDLGYANDLQKKIQHSMETILKTINPVISSILVCDIDEEPACTDSLHKDEASEKQTLFMVILDNYFREQLLWAGYGLLQPIRSHIIDDYQSQSEIIRLNAYYLIDKKPTPDTLTTWQTKQDYLCLLSQAVRVSSIPAKDFTELMQQTKINLNYKIDYEHLIRFYHNSCLFLQEELKQLSNQATTPTEIKDITKQVIQLTHNLHYNYQKFFPELLTPDEAKSSIEPDLTKCIFQIHQVFLECFTRAFLKDFSNSPPISDVKNCVDFALTTAEHIHIILGSTLSSLGQTPKKFEETYQVIIHTLFVTTLNYLGQLYTNRNILTKAFTSLGGRTSQTRELLKHLKHSYQERFPFLFTPSTSPHLSLVENFVELEKYMDELDHTATESAKNTIYNYLESSSITSSIASWWKKK